MTQDGLQTNAGVTFGQRKYRIKNMQNLFSSSNNNAAGANGLTTSGNQTGENSHTSSIFHSMRQSTDGKYYQES